MWRPLPGHHVRLRLIYPEKKPQKPASEHKADSKKGTAEARVSFTGTGVYDPRTSTCRVYIYWVLTGSLQTDGLWKLWVSKSSHRRGRAFPRPQHRPHPRPKLRYRYWKTQTGHKGVTVLQWHNSIWGQPVNQNGWRECLTWPVHGPWLNLVS